MVITVGVVIHEHGTNVYAATTRRGVLDQIAKYCRDWWNSEDVPNDFVDENGENRNDDDVIREYFDHVENESYIVDETKLCGDLTAALDLC